MMKNYRILVSGSLILLMTSCASRNGSKEQTPVDDVVQGTTDSLPVQPDTAISVPETDTIAVDTNTLQETIPEKEPLNIGKISYAGEQAIIYKTKKDYSKFVPVTLSADKSKIISYPSPKDVFYKGKLALPVKLTDGFWLDNRGVNANTAFLKLTYEDYSKLSEAPLLADMFSGIEDKDPVTEIYSLGTRARYKNEKKEMNEIIDRGALKKFKKIK